MFDFMKRKKPSDTEEQKPAGMFARLKQSLAKTRAGFTSGLATLILRKKELNADVLNEIEMLLLTADVGVDTTEQLIKSLTQKLSRKELSDTEAALDCLQAEMKQILKPCEVPLTIASEKKPYVILVVGVNGSGKTTSIGKLAHFLKEEQHHVMLAAGDTFRAAAIEQLQIWGERNHIPVIAQQPGADTAAVIFDAMEAAKARGADVLIADTAGRLHTQSNLMSELQKVKRVLTKIDPTAPHEILIVLDATLGQNALNQVKQFNDAVGITGIALTKLDGTAKGGIIFLSRRQRASPFALLAWEKAWKIYGLFRLMNLLMRYSRSRYVHVAYLILDLDLTSIVNCSADSTDLKDLHPNHTLHQPAFLAKGIHKGVDVDFPAKILNRPELSGLIQYALEHHDGVIFFTNGMYYLMREQIAEQLDLTSAAKEKLKKSQFHSPVTGRVYFPGLTPLNIRLKTKRERFEVICHAHPHLQGKGFVLVDDSIDHLTPFAGVPHVATVLATTWRTSSGKKDFYDEAMRKLDVAKDRELKSSLASSPDRLFALQPPPGGGCVGPRVDCAVSAPGCAIL